MALSIHTNYSALVTQTNLSKSNNALGTNQQRLGTGFRINSAADDAAGLQIATRLNAGSRGMAVAMRNVGDSVSMLQTAEGAFSEMTNIVQRMKDLATQGANATNSGSDLIALQNEYDELGKEMANIVKNTRYAGKTLFSNGTTVDGSGGTMSAAMVFQIGSSAGETMSVDLSAKLTALGTALTNAADTYATPGTPGVEIASTQVATTAANTNANGTITVLETALNSLGELRASFGANINRLNHTSNNLANMRDNTEMAKGRIMDADFAMESANMSKNSMLMQSGISMLKQAGQMPGMVMSLLG
ncbi:Lateral flagellin [Pseudomonas sp. 8AS]|uniref:lateral flagellin LafA n=1 Tax=Pseudomonas sp. 8AS TaxID=2653163 RepID=UPI0012F01C5C|nr:lateral flagellin LafA [Pseudomonas sp. 8AS]VXC27142.1 Lateral flagellin [Pseudomonas sp. 8AS]